MRKKNIMQKDIRELEPNELGGLLKIVSTLFILVFAYFFLTVGVQAGNVGIQDTFGNVSEYTLPQGFHLKAPWTRIVPMNFQTQKYVASANSASQDLQDVTTEVTLNYHIDKGRAVEIYNNYSVDYQDRVIIPAVQETVKAVTARFNATELITQRPVVKTQVEELISKKLGTYGMIIETVSLTDFSFSDSFDEAIEAKVTAEQRALEAVNKLEQIKTEKLQQITQAEAEAESIRLRADARAYELQVLQEQLEKSPDLIPFKAVERWDGVLPYFTGGSIPFVNVPTNNAGNGE